MVYHAKSNAAREVPSCWQVYDRCTGELASRPNRSRSERKLRPTNHVAYQLSFKFAVLLKHSLLTLHLIVLNSLYLGWLVYSIFCNPRMLLHEILSPRLVRGGLLRS